ncbi:MAG: hypothetical protein AAFQ92_21465 [Bacteroidota bacterium]
MLSSIKYQTVRITIPSGAAGASISPSKFSFDTQYLRCSGMYIPEVESFAPPIRMKVGDEDTTYQHLTNVRDFAATTNVPHEDRFKYVDIEAKGNNMILNFERIGAMAEEVSFDLVFRLEDSVR